MAIYYADFVIMYLTYKLLNEFQLSKNKELYPLWTQFHMSIMSHIYKVINKTISQQKRKEKEK